MLSLFSNMCLSDVYPLMNYSPAFVIRLLKLQSVGQQQKGLFKKRVTFERKLCGFLTFLTAITLKNRSMYRIPEKFKRRGFCQFNPECV